ncbi:hypothetical protein HDU93_000750 [Gonapodya sp. JEL0774]|nr:hypothetical protein HDU93_000750 [Gonapodya sp. JEL0774]
MFLDPQHAPTPEETQDLDVLDRKIAGQEHNFGGKLVKGYHGVTRGWFLNAVLRRLGDRKSHGQLLREWINPGLGIEVYCGVPEIVLPRINPMIQSQLLALTRSLPVPEKAKTSPGYKSGQSFKVTLPQGVVQPANVPSVIKGETPSAYTVTNARALAKLAAIMANRGTLDGFTLMDPKTWAEAHTLETRNLDQPDVAFGAKVRTTWAGWGLSFPGLLVPQTVVEFDEKNLAKPPRLAFKPYMKGTGWSWCGWFGYGGSAIQWESSHQVGFGYVPNLMGAGTAGDIRSAELCAEVVKIVKGLEGGKL